MGDLANSNVKNVFGTLNARAYPMHLFKRLRIFNISNMFSGNTDAEILVLPGSLWAKKLF